jgi:hypothetical protein
MHVATRSLLITTANLLWTFNISKATQVDPQTGKEAEIDIDTLAFTNVANSHPLPFRAAFHERFPGAKKAQLELEGL